MPGAEPPKKTEAIRSYLNSTISPSLLTALIELDKKEYTSRADEDLKVNRPIVWLAKYLEEMDGLK